MRSLWVETVVVLGLAVVPEIAVSVLYLTRLASQPAYTFVYLTLTLLLRSVQVGVPVLYIIHRSGEAWSTFGLSRPRWLRDALLGICLPICAWVFYAIVFRVAWIILAVTVESPAREAFASDTSRFFPAPSGALAWFLLVVCSCANGFTEELVMRGYLIPRLEGLLGGVWRSILITSALFAAYHAYQGPWGVVSAAIFGLLSGGAFCLVRRIWPLVIAHALGDIWVMALVSGA